MKDKPKFIQFLDNQGIPEISININNIAYVINNPNNDSEVLIQFIGKEQAIILYPEQGKLLLEKLKELAGES